MEECSGGGVRLGPLGIWGGGRHGGRTPAHRCRPHIAQGGGPRVRPDQTHGPACSVGQEREVSRGQLVPRCRAEAQGRREHGWKGE